MNSLSSAQTAAARLTDLLPDSSGVVSLEQYRAQREQLGMPAPELEAAPRAGSDAEYADYSVAFLSAARRHEQRTIALLRGGRPDQAALHHLTGSLLRHYATARGVRRLAVMPSAVDGGQSPHAVHRNATLFFRAVVEAFYREHIRESGGKGRLSVVDPFENVLNAFRTLGFERRYNAVVGAYSAQLQRTDHAADEMLLQMERDYRPFLN